jgi:CheY-like chemotaxis protein
MPKQPLVVLMVEDNEHDILATQRAWRTQRIANPLYIVTDGEACLSYLHQRGPYSAPGIAPSPGLLLLDLNLPRLDGISVLKHIREDDRLHCLPVVIFTTSRLEADRIRSYNLHVNAYIRKPIGFHRFAETLRIINLFWELVEWPE